MLAFVMLLPVTTPRLPERLWMVFPWQSPVSVVVWGLIDELGLTEIEQLDGR